MFSENSDGFRSNRRCEQAIIKLLEYFNDGYLWIVDIDLEKFPSTRSSSNRLCTWKKLLTNDGKYAILIIQMYKLEVLL